MRINLIFAPYVSPSCVPIGIASLKSYLEKSMKGVSVKTIDLDINFVNKVIKGEVKDICSACRFKNSDKCWAYRQGFKNPYKIPEELSRRFRQAKEFVKNKKLFYNKRFFVWCIAPLFNFVGRYFDCFSLILKDYFEGRIHDEEIVFDLIKDEVKKAMEGNPKLIGFSALTDTQSYFSIAMAKIIKKKYNVPIAFGGPGFFHAFDLKSLMETFEFIDFIVVKEGEEALLELIKRLSEGADYENVPNLIWRKKGKIIFNKERTIKNLDELPTPDFSDFDLNKYYSPEPILPISTSRNCPWNMCKFCQLNANYGDKYRERSIEKVIDDIKKLKVKYGVDNFFLTDSDITPARFKEIGQAVSNTNLQVFFASHARPTKSLNYEVLKVAYNGGFRFLCAGIEAFSNRLLKFVDKGTSTESIMAFLKNTSKLRITLLCYMLCAIPTQTREEFLNDLKEIAALQKKYNNIPLVIYSFFNLGKRMKFFEEMEKYGIVITGRGEAFCTTTSKKVYLEDWLKWRYENKGAYDILGDDNVEINSPLKARALLDKRMKRFETNKADYLFIHLINNFLFETQLLYAKRLAESLPQRMSKLVKQLIPH